MAANTLKRLLAAVVARTEKVSARSIMRCTLLWLTIPGLAAGQTNQTSPTSGSVPTALQAAKFFISRCATPSQGASLQPRPDRKRRKCPHGSWRSSELLHLGPIDRFDQCVPCRKVSIQSSGSHTGVSGDVVQAGVRPRGPVLNALWACRKNFATGGSLRLSYLLIRRHSPF